MSGYPRVEIKPRLLRIKNAVIYLDFPSEAALRMAISRGTIPSSAVVTLDGRVWLDRLELDRFITRQRGKRLEQPQHLCKKEERVGKAEDKK